MKRRSHRPERVSEVIRHAVGVFLTADVRDPRIGFVTVTGVEVTPDLRQATVYYSALAPVRGDADAVAVVAESNHHLIEVLDTLERYVRSAPDVEVLDTTAAYLEPED